MKVMNLVYHNEKTVEDCLKKMCRISSRAIVVFAAIEKLKKVNSKKTCAVRFNNKENKPIHNRTFDAEYTLNS